MHHDKHLVRPEQIICDMENRLKTARNRLGDQAGSKDADAKSMVKAVQQIAMAAIQICKSVSDTITGQFTATMQVVMSDAQQTIKSMGDNIAFAGEAIVV